MNRSLTLLTSQMKRIGRDNMLIVLMVYPFILAIIGRYIIPVIASATLTDAFNLMDYSHILLIFFVIVNPVLYGDIIGLMLLDEREDNTLSAISVLPIPMWQYIFSKCLIFAVISTLSGMITIIAIDLYPVPLLASLIINLSSSLGVGFAMILINVFASNKVQGFAVMKATSGILMLPAIVAFFLPKPLSFLCGFCPVFWPSMTIASYSGLYDPLFNRWIYIVVGSVYIVVITIIMYRHTIQKIRN